MPGMQMVRLVTASSPMEAKLIAARLGAEGFTWELRGSVDGPLAFGPIEVLVETSAVAEARELLLSDEVEAVFAADDEPPRRETTGRDVLVVVAVLVVALLFAIARMAARV